MGALTVNAADQVKNAADQVKRSHKLHAQARTGKATTTRLADCPGASTVPTAQEPGFLERLGHFLDKWILPALGILSLGGILAAGMQSFRAHEQSASPVKAESEANLQKNEASFNAITEKLSQEAKALFDKTGIDNFKDLQEYLSRTTVTIQQNASEFADDIQKTDEFRALESKHAELAEVGGSLKKTISMILTDISKPELKERFDLAFNKLQDLFSSAEFPKVLEMLNTKFPQAVEVKGPPKEIVID